MNQYFSHDTNARNDEKLLNVRMKLGAEGYGIYFMILERLAEVEDHIAGTNYLAIAYDLHVDTEKIRSVVEDFGLFTVDADNQLFWSESMNRRQEKKDGISKMRSEFGKRSAEKRNSAKVEQESNISSTNVPTRVEQTKSISSTSLLKEKKENKINNNPPHLSPLEAAGAAEEEPKVKEDYFSRYEKRQDITGSINTTVSATDVMKLQRFCSDRSRSPAILAMLKDWKSPIYELIQQLEREEQSGNLHPVPYPEWKTMSRLYTLGKKDVDHIKSIIRKDGSKWTELMKAVTDADGNKKITVPSRYIISRIS